MTVNGVIDRLLAFPTGQAEPNPKRSKPEDCSQSVQPIAPKSSDETERDSAVHLVRDLFHAEDKVKVRLVQPLFFSILQSLLWCRPGTQKSPRP